MGRKASDPANAFSVRVLHEIEQARVDAGVPQREMFENAGMSANYFYKRLRGEAPLNTNDVHNLAQAIGHDAIFIMQRAANAGSKTERIASVTPLSANVGGSGKDVDPHEIDLSKTDLELAATHDRSGIKEQNHPDYENESQDTENGE